MKKLSNNANIDFIQYIKENFGGVLKEGKIDFNLLKELLGENNVDEESYSFNWIGKNDSIRYSSSSMTGTLKPVKEKSFNFNETNNIYIMGDNGEVLKALQKTYYNKINMIYIDPPYNTGNEFIYKDDFSDNISNYKKLNNSSYRANANTDGRFHTNWLNMMYSRLILAKNLLKSSGSILISIDDNEVCNLRKVCDEIFGENNFVCQFVWQKNFAPKNDNRYISNSHEYILLYAKNKELFNRNLLPRSDKNNSGYSNPDNDPRGPWTSGTALAISYNEKGVFEIVAPNGKKHIPTGGRCWRYSQETFKRLMDDNRIWFGMDGNGVPRVKRFLSEMPDGIVPQSLLKYEDVGSSQDGTKDIKEIFDGKVVFDYAKPVKLIKHLIGICSNDGDTILDFFSGSATTAQAVMEFDNEHKTQRHFIMVQLPESVRLSSGAGDEKYNTICDIGIERINRTRLKLQNKCNDLFYNFNQDLGFKVFKLDSSNIRAWDPSTKLDEKTIFNQAETIKEDRTDLDVAYEIMLKYGVFNMPLEEVTINGKPMFNIGKGFLIIDLNNNITLEDVEKIGKEKPHCVVFKESGFGIDDNVKLNATKTLQTYGVQDIKCL